MLKLKKNSEFQKIYNKGKKTFGYYSIIFFKENTYNKNRYGFVASKKIGNAVCRNRIKRLLKESCRLNDEFFKQGYDIIFVSKKTAGEKIKTISFEEIKNDIKTIFKKSKLIENNNN